MNVIFEQLNYIYFKLDSNSNYNIRSLHNVILNIILTGIKEFLGLEQRWTLNSI
jgi:hypothetical protein